jgi:hypothetical protein
MQQASDLSKITSINFEGVGQLSHFDEGTGLITKPFYIIPSNFIIPFSDPKIVAQRINQELQAIESLRYKYDESKYYWEIEFGTKPTELTIDTKDYKMKGIIKLKKWAAMQAATSALDKYPNLCEEYDEDYLPPPPMGLKWCRFVIHLYYDEETKEIIVEFNRVWGDSDSFTYYQFFNFVKKAFIN